jgi:hypothetical protein
MPSGAIASTPAIQYREPTVTKDKFIAELAAALGTHTDAARDQLARLLTAIPAQATELQLEVFPSQDGDGFFAIRAGVVGPDLYVINKAIDKYADMFAPRYNETGVEPPIPMVHPEGVNYCVNDILVDCAAKWLQAVWQSLGDVDCQVPVVVIGHDDYGTLTPLELN